MKVLVACERSGVVREAFRRNGHDAWSCDLEPAEDGSPYHIQGDALEAAYAYSWDMMIAHPECKYLCGSGLHWNKRRPERARLTEEAVEFALALWNAPISRVCLENSVGILSTRLRKPDQVIQPYQFGEDASKATCLWLRGLPPLAPTKRVPGRIVNGKERWANQTDSGQNRLGPSPTRSMDRARTYPGIANAMAQQWNFSGPATLPRDCILRGGSHVPSCHPDDPYRCVLCGADARVTDSASPSHDPERIALPRCRCGGFPRPSLMGQMVCSVCGNTVTVSEVQK